jgi:hypothetical protein
VIRSTLAHRGQAAQQGSDERQVSEDISVQLTFHCPACGQLNRTGEPPATGTLGCVHCAWTRSVAASQTPLTSCVVCGNADLWRQKDFPQSLGLALVAAGAVLSSIAWYFHWPQTALGLLMAFALADMLVFMLMPDVLVCYRCKARHRAVPSSLAEHSAFSHETAERYRQQELRHREAQNSRPA